jgi:hypothetical protein
MEPRSTQRPRPVILAAAAVVLAGALVYMMWPAASPQPAPSNPPREQRPVATTSAAAPAQLDVRLEALKQPPPQPSGEARNPYRFYVKPPPPPPPPTAAPPVRPAPDGPAPPPPPPTFPPIPLKFIGTMEQGKKKVAIFSDGRGVPVYASEGELVLGQYRLVRIQIESVVMEYADGRGRQTIPMRG